MRKYFVWGPKINTTHDPACVAHLVEQDCLRCGQYQEVNLSNNRSNDTNLCFSRFLFSSVIRRSLWSLINVSKASCFPIDNCGPNIKKTPALNHVLYSNNHISCSSYRHIHNENTTQATVWTRYRICHAAEINLQTKEAVLDHACRS